MRSQQDLHVEWCRPFREAMGPPRGRGFEDVHTLTVKGALDLGWTEALRSCVSNVL